MTKVIVLNGPPQSGKDTIVKYLINNWPDVFERLKFATPLKEACHVLCGEASGHEDFEVTKDEPCNFFFGVSPREFYIDIGEYVKRRYTQEFFGMVFLRRYRWLGVEQSKKVVLITDCGFGQELEPLIRYFENENMCLIRIRREGRGFEGDSRGYISGVLEREYDVDNPNDNFAKFYDNLMIVLRKEVLLDDFV